MLLAGLVLLFFSSGFCALIYQVLWLRMLGWVFGVTVHAASTVWAAFMAGLGIGGIAAGYAAERVRRPLLWFGIIEASIGVTAFATPTALALLQRLYADLHTSLPDSPIAITLVRLAIAFAVLLVPTVLMGATLPLVVKASDVRNGPIGEQLGVLYGSNAAGAIAGTLAAGLFLIPGLGIRGTFTIAALTNVATGAAAILLARRTAAWRLPTAATELPPAPTSDVRATHVASPTARLAVLLVFTVSGVISLALEVVWFRVLTLFLRPTVYGFSVMLATILAGVALGSYIAAPFLERRLRWFGVLALLELAISVTIVLSFRPLTLLLDLSNSLAPLLGRVMPEYLVFPIAGSLLAIFPTALLMGIAFPIGLHLWATTRNGAPRQKKAERIGLFYSLNVAGGIVGSLAAGFILLPLVGSRRSLILLAAVSFVSGLLLLAFAEIGRIARATVAVAALAVFGAAVAAAPDPFDEFIRQRYPGRQITWREEGVEATVVVHRSRSEMSLTVNGNHEASTGGAMTYVHRRIGHLPMAVHPQPREALVIGLGGGATAGAVSVHEGVHVDVVELAGAVVRGARFFDDINYGVLSRPNVTVRVDDGRNYLMLTPKRYDVVTADVIIPIFAGSGNLYSAEYFGLMRRVLKPGGLVLQWVSGTDAEYKMIARTFLNVFPETTAWVDGGLLIGSLEPLKLRRADFEWKQQLPGYAQGFADLNIRSYDALLAAFTAGPDELRAFVGPGPILTDDKPLVEYFLSLPRDRAVDLSTLKGDVRRYVADD